MLGVRAIVHFGNQYFSPVYGHYAWLPGAIGIATCAIGCSDVPNDRHQGCGFHAHFKILDTIEFVRQIRGMADVIVLCEFSGKIAVHERGLRAEYAKIVAVSNYNPLEDMYSHFDDTFFGSRSQVSFASQYFGVPILTVDEVQKRIDAEAKTFGRR